MANCKFIILHTFIKSAKADVDKLVKRYPMVTGCGMFLVAEAILRMDFSTMGIMNMFVLESREGVTGIREYKDKRVFFVFLSFFRIFATKILK